MAYGMAYINKYFLNVSGLRETFLGSASNCIHNCFKSVID